jgi:mono/diheme cytochrome c family protein
MKIRGVLVAATALLGVGGLMLQARGETDGGAALALGKKIFVERCAKCHGEDGTKPVGDGLPLSERTLSDEQLARSVRGRLRSATETEQKAVFAYIRSFQKN